MTKEVKNVEIQDYEELVKHMSEMPIGSIFNLHIQNEYYVTVKKIEKGR